MIIIAVAASILLVAASAWAITAVAHASSVRDAAAKAAAARAVAVTPPAPDVTSATVAATDSVAATSAEQVVDAAADTTPATTPKPVAPKPAPTPAPTVKATGFVVVIDAGHQGKGDNRPEPIGPGSKTTKPAVADGTAGVATHIRESVINLRVALKLRDLLQASGVKVIMIRTTENVDIPNSKRAEIANAAHAGLFIRLHCDGVNSSSVHGFLTLVPAKNQWTGPIVSSSARAGRDIHAATLAATGAYNRGITPRGDMSGFNWSRVPSVIVEMGVMSNPAEDRKLATASYEQTLASGIAKGVLTFAAGK